VREQPLFNKLDGVFADVEGDGAEGLRTAANSDIHKIVEALKRGGAKTEAL
jgi:hypothetical protein